MRLTEHFTPAEFTRSQTATRHGLDNKPPGEAKAALLALCTHVLEPIRKLLDKPIVITSGYRSAGLNYAIGGSTNSQHIKGEAADFYVLGMTCAEAFDEIWDSGIVFDQMILENPAADGWVHISYKPFGENRRQVLIADFKGKKVAYRIPEKGTNKGESHA